jgi:hypothetical protein
VFKHDWEQGEATIITSATGNNFAPHADWGTVSVREYVVDVRPVAGGPLFRATIKQIYGEPEGAPGQKYRVLSTGEVVGVRFDPKRQKVKFDDSDPRRFKPRPSGPTAFEAAAAAAPGTPAPAQPSPPSLGAKPSSKGPAPRGSTPDDALVGSLSLAEILATGVPVRVVVVESDAWSPPTTDNAGHPVYRFLLTVVQDGVDPSRNEEAQGVPPYALPLIYPGANLPAKVAMGQQVAIDWEAAQQEASTGRP